MENRTVSKINLEQERSPKRKVEEFNNVPEDKIENCYRIRLLI